MELNNLDWDKMHKALRRSREEVTTTRQFVGDNLDSWFGFAQSGGCDMLEDLMECIITDIRRSQRPSQEEEDYIRLGFTGVLQTIRACHAEHINLMQTNHETIDNEKESDRILAKI